MPITPEILPDLIKAVVEIIEHNAEEVTALDQELGDGDHVINLQRGLEALAEQTAELATLEFAQAMQKIGMTLLSTMGGASGSLFGTLFISISKAAKDKQVLTQQDFVSSFSQGVEAVKKRGKADAGEKTMLDVLIPVANNMQKNMGTDIGFLGFLQEVSQTAQAGMESTADMLATKGRASYLGEKSIGHIDAGARTSQLMICAIVKVLKEQVKG